MLSSSVCLLSVYTCHVTFICFYARSHLDLPVFMTVPFSFASFSSVPPPIPTQVLREETLALSLDFACFLVAHVRFGLELCYGCISATFGELSYFWCFKFMLLCLCKTEFVVMENNDFGYLVLWMKKALTILKVMKFIFWFFRCFIYVLSCNISVFIYLDNAPPKLVHSLCEWP